PKAPTTSSSAVTTIVSLLTRRISATDPRDIGDASHGGQKSELLSDVGEDLVRGLLRQSGGTNGLSFVPGVSEVQQQRPLGIREAHRGVGLAKLSFHAHIMRRQPGAR